MGKRLDQLDLPADQPAITSATQLARATSAAEVTLEEIGELLDDARFSFSWDFLQDLKLSIQVKGVATAAQRQAIRNIRSGVQRNADRREDHTTRGGRRRYEGWGR